MAWRDVVWRGVVLGEVGRNLTQCGVACLCVVWCGAVRLGVVWCSVAWRCAMRCGVQCGAVWCSVVWRGAVRCGVLWYGVV